MDNINITIFNDEKIIEYISNHPCTILKIKQTKIRTINKFSKTDIVMVVNVLTNSNTKKIWCLTLTQVESNKNNYKIEEESKNENKNQTLPQDTGKIQEFNYEYMLINFSDIIDIYEKPNVDKIESFYQKENLVNYFTFHEEKYYFKEDMKSLYVALKYFYRIIINSFSKKSDEISEKKLKNKNENNIKNRKKKTLVYKKIIDDIEQKEKTKQKLLQKYNANPCLKCELYKEHLTQYKDVLKIKKEISKIEKEISEGDQIETEKKFNNRIKLLKDLDYLKNDDDHEDDKDKPNYENCYLTTKGKASIEIITNDNIFITELLSSGIFIKDSNIISKEIIVPFISIFVGNEKKKDLKHNIKIEDQKNNDDLNVLLDKFHKIYQDLIDKEKKYELNESHYNRSFCFNYFESVYYWMLGNHFCEVCNKYRIVEGKLYQIILRTIYFTEEIINFYRILGNQTLVEVFRDIKDKLLKGIMGVESLYIQENIDIDNI